MTHEVYYCLLLSSRKFDCYSSEFFELISCSASWFPLSDIYNSYRPCVEVTLCDKVTNEIIVIPCRGMSLRSHFSSPHCDNYNFITYNK